MGHLPIRLLSFLFPEIIEHFVKPYMFCTICPLGKQTRSVYPSSVCRSQKPLELLHIDVWGTFRTKTRNNCSLFVTIADDFSKMSWIFLIKHNSEFLNVFKHIVTFIENQLDTKVKCVRTDNANELTKGEALQFYVQHGIKLQTSCTDTPQ